MDTLLPPPSPSLAELLAFLSQSESTCIVRARAGEREGEICLERGDVTYVSFGGLHGGRAMLALLAARELEYQVVGDSEAVGHAVLEPEDTPVDAGVEHDAQLAANLADREREARAEGAWLGTDDDERDATQDRGLDVEAASQPPERDEETDPRLILPSPWGSETPASACEPPLARDAEAASERPSLEILAEPQDQDVAPPSSRPSSRPREGGRERAAEVDAGVAQWAALMLGDRTGRRSEVARVVSAQASIPPPPTLPSRRLLAWLAVAVAAPLLGLGLVWSARTSSASGREKVKPAVAAAARPAQLLAGPPAEIAPNTFVPTILLSVLVGVDGAASEARVVSPRPTLAEFEARALERVKSYRFLPALAAGKPVAQRLTVPVSFSVRAGKSTPTQLTIKGSDTMGAALAPGWARAFAARQPGLEIKVEGLGSSTGFVGLFDGSAAIAAASRPIRADELAFARKLDLQVREVTVGYDGIAVIVHRDNRLRSLDLRSVARVFAGQVTRWGELGGRDAAIRVIGRPSYSGTHAFFKEKVLGAIDATAAFGPHVEIQESAQRIVERVSSDVDAIAYVGLGQINPNVHVLALQAVGGGKPITPSPSSVRDGSYPIARPLLLYIRGDSDRATRAFVDFTLSHEGQSLVDQSGFVSLDQPVMLGLSSEADVPRRAPPTMLRVYFEEGRAEVTPSSRAELAVAAAALRQQHRALVIGNADSSGDTAKNELLARRRAQVVVAQLEQLGVGDAPLDVQVASVDRPLATNLTADGRKANRRVDLVLIAR